MFSRLFLPTVAIVLSLPSYSFGQSNTRVSGEQKGAQYQDVKDGEEPTSSSKMIPENSENTPSKQSQDNDEPSVSRQFLKIFEKSSQDEKIKERSGHTLTSGKGISVTKPDGWIHRSTTNPNIVLLFIQAGEPMNRIEIRKGNNIAASKRSFYLDSIRIQIEQDGFIPVYLDDTNDENPTNQPGVEQKRTIGGLTGDYTIFRVSDSPRLRELRGKKDLGLILFLYEGKNEAWIFACYSLNGKIKTIQPVFDELIKSAQFDFK